LELLSIAQRGFDGQFYVNENCCSLLHLLAYFTKKHLPVELAYCEECQSIADAFRREKQVQGWTRDSGVA
jgi:hypothetical protein